MPKATVTTALFCAGLLSPFQAGADPTVPAPPPADQAGSATDMDQHWIVRLAEQAASAGPDSNPYENMGQMIYTAQMRATPLSELRGALAELERRAASPERGRDVSVTRVFADTLRTLIIQHGQKIPTISADGLGYKEFEARD